ncbi:hypothetical protein D3C75_1224860 [compost metagenome]
MIGGARVVLEKQGPGIAIEVDVENRHRPWLAIAGQPVAGRADLEQQLVGLQQTWTGQVTLDKTAQ